MRILKPLWMTLAFMTLPAAAFADINSRAQSAFNEIAHEPIPTACGKAEAIARIATTLHDAQEHYLVRGAMLLAVDSYFAREPMESNRDWYIAVIDGVAMSYGIKTPSC